MKPTYLFPAVFLVFLLPVGQANMVSGQDCVPIQVQIPGMCVKSLVVKKEPLASMRKAKAEALQSLFYDYFKGTDYAGYKKLFLPADWYGLTETEFRTWRAFLNQKHLESAAVLIVQSGMQELGVMKYTYELDQKRVYETFTAKRANGRWVPVSQEEEQTYMRLTNTVKYINPDYLLQCWNQSRDTSDPGGSPAPLAADQWISERTTCKIEKPDQYRSRYNDDFDYLTRDTYEADRLHDSAFVAFLLEMKLTDDQVWKVMQVIYLQDYLLAADLADRFSETTYTYGPFIDKIREVYGRDRLPIWDIHENRWN